MSIGKGGSRMKSSLDESGDGLQLTNAAANQMKFLSLNRDGRSAFSLYKVDTFDDSSGFHQDDHHHHFLNDGNVKDQRQFPSTILTNLQRGNIKTQSPREIPDRSIFELAAQGELYLHQIEDCKVDQVDDHNYTALIWAAAYGQLATVKLLISKGANPQHKGKNGETGLSFAAANGHVHVLRYLLACDVDVDDYDEEGNTALMYASCNNHALCVLELLKAKADMTIQNCNLETAFSISISRKSKQVQVIFERFILNHLTESNS